MKKIFCYCLIALLVGGCWNLKHGDNIQEMQVQTIDANDMGTTATSTIQPNPTVVPTLTSTATLAIDDSFPQLNSKCLTITDSPPTSNDIIVLRSLQSIDNHQSSNIILIDMYQQQSNVITPNPRFTPNFAVSENKMFIAYEASTIQNENVLNLDLIVADGHFQTKHTLPWKDNWDTIVGWTSDNKIIISIFPETTLLPPASYVIVDPADGSEKAISLSMPDFLNKSIYDLPYWNGWYGLSINPTINLAVYPRQNNIKKDMFTYGIWDMSSNKIVISLENIFSAFSNFNDTFPLPKWSRDGKQFVFVGTKEDVTPSTFELYRITQDGNIDQLTNISGFAYIWDSGYSWSPDSSNIVFFLGPLMGAGSTSASLALANTVSHEVTNLCLSVGFQGNSEGPTTPIWSPNKKQFLVIDKYETEHQRVLLVDTEKMIVFPIAEDAEPIGWMIRP